MLNRIISKADNTKVITFLYFFLLLYTIAILVWWGILLYKQNNHITRLEITNLELREQTGQLKESYLAEWNRIDKARRLHNLQYIGEGGTFLLIILLSAGYVFLTMRRQIRFSRQQQNFMAAVTHELKSPIAVLKLNLETLKKHKLDPSRHEKLYDNTLGELRRLDQLCNNMLLASQFDSRRYHLVKERVNLSQLLGELAEQYRVRMRDHRLQADIAADVLVSAEAFMLQIAVSNLIENATKYAPRGSAVNLTLARSESQAIIRVADEGEGVSPDERERIFSRFYRSGNENTRRSKGTGLGLFLTKKIVEQHHGRIVVHANTPKGSIFEITLPRLTT